MLSFRIFTHFLLIALAGCSLQPKLLLVDGERKFTQESNGALKGAEGFTTSQIQTIKGLLGGARFPVPNYLKDILTDDYDAVDGEELIVLEPVKVIVTTDSPIFRWKPVSGMNSYQVLIRDHRDIVVKRSGNIAETEWTPSKPLAQGEVFHWRVTAGKGKEEAVSHWTKFAVPGEAALAEIDATRKLGSRLLLAIAYARCGALSSADKELAELERTNVGSDLVKRWRGELQPGELKPNALR